MPTAATTDFVPAAFDGTDWAQIEPLARALIDRPVRTRTDMEKWLLDRSELDAACSEAGTDLHITSTCFTDDQNAQQTYATYIQEIPPRMKPLAFELDKKMARLSREVGLLEGEGKRRYEVIERDTRAEVELFRPENVPLETELELLGQEYDQIIGAMGVVFEGREQTLPMMARYQESTDRSVREAAWRAVAVRRLKERDKLDSLFDAMVAKRDLCARNAGFEDYVGYIFKAKKRFDYTSRHCFAFHQACETEVVPMLRRLDRQRRASLNLEALRPWDLAVDVKGRPPLKPFQDGRELMGRSVSVFKKLDPRLAAMLSSMGDGSEARGSKDGACLDLDSRKGKAPGGYQSMRDRQRVPFIFMNAAGLQRDVSTMLHESGHAFHSMLCVDEPLLHYRSAPLEFCEVASMAMELLTMPYLGGADGFYQSEEDLARHRRNQIEKSVTLLPWIATIDAFQHWLYSNPNHTRPERTKFWLSLDDRFGNAVSWTGLESYRESLWHRQLHLFRAPFYYIEYGIAQLGALGLWLMSLEKGEKAAVEAYLNGLRLGGSRPLPELFKASGLPFDFGPEIVKRIVERAERELEKLPE